jgi:AcrR family transcriptional regulator
MGRPRGARSPDYDKKRGELIERLTDHALSADIHRASLRELAAAAGVSVPTLRHYFGDREGAVSVIMECIAARGKPYIAFVASPGGDFASSVRGYLDLSRLGMEHGGFARAHAFGIVEGSGAEPLGVAYLETLLEPSLTALQTRLESHVQSGEMRKCDTRAAAIHLFAPLMVLMLHQQILNGTKTHPIDLSGFVNDIAASFIRAYSAKQVPA